ncbi:hypothetical protein AFCDBAGC_2700 [Methylobacterium cerastii]|uniref:Helix-turn-helix domain-containing protein n=1 Tax=Methylobacterium cerastii TaxID=932741 RepID=A0ABQ4QII1_9HYPH|nr:helix-turn-helix domain-containing protein [Methylobacterium cerastii]GJD44831.1 hypothetical protein AFCDBAGC_2700 [Methylobacterium cerastii]
MYEPLKTAIDNGTGVSVPLLAKALGVSRNAIYRAIDRKEIHATSIGRRVVIPADVAAQVAGMKPEPIAA